MKWMAHLWSVFYPSCCAGCSGVLYEHETVICAACRHELQPTLFETNQQNPIMHRVYGRYNVLFGAAHFYYDKGSVVQQLIHGLKYKGHQNIGTVLGNWYGHNIKTSPQLQSVAMVIPVPLHGRRLRQRGYNQVEAYGVAMASVLNVPYNNEVLYRTRYNTTLSKKSLRGRNETNTALFSVRNPEKYTGKHILLVDDVFTSGATLERCCSALQVIPNVKISLVCMVISR
jgi:ComF family protein